MSFQLTTADQASLLNGVKVLGYGRAGVGKTSLCATAPKPCVLSAESGLLSLKKKNIIKMFGSGRKDIAYDVPVNVISSLQDLVDAEAYFRTNAEARKWFSTICLDSVTEIAEKVLANAKLTDKDPRKSYLVMQEQMIDVVKKFRDLEGYNVYMASKEEKFKDEGSGLTLFGPSMPGAKLGPQLPYLFDEVFNINVGVDKDGKSYRYLRTQPDLQYDAKDRSGSLDEIEYPHLGMIFNKITA